MLPLSTCYPKRGGWQFEREENGVERRQLISDLLSANSLGPTVQKQLPFNLPHLHKLKISCLRKLSDFPTTQQKHTRQFTKSLGSLEGRYIYLTLPSFLLLVSELIFNSCFHYSKASF